MLSDEEIKKIVIARLMVIPENYRLSIGGALEPLSGKDMIMHVEKGDEIGKKIVEIELRFLQAMKTGLTVK